MLNARTLEGKKNRDRFHENGVDESRLSIHLVLQTLDSPLSPFQLQS